ncbi:sulfatase-like hydrolase/transferase [Halorhabdus rudnickae]|uniref:sulfatase-like hydrolase/transferase n=1 Tax=Halorhabdus rudnickae TaxID=1775544 RepID=UPI0010840F25|nr:sulfatase-like hydrolase/transferase [Halorhabdus rudnickae]
MVETGPNVLLIILDSARAKNASLLGYHRETTPFLESFAETATTYTQARAPAGRSLPSHASIFSGLLPQEHGINDLNSKLSREANIFGQLRNRGYETGLFTDNPYLTDLDTGLSDSIDLVENNRDLYQEGESPSAFVEEASLNRMAFFRRALNSSAPGKSLLNGAAWMLKWRFPRLAPTGTVFSRGFTYAERFEEWYTGTDRPWAACINLMDTHVPFRPGEQYDRWNTSDSRKAYKRADMDRIQDGERWKHSLLENRYDGTIRQADAVVEEIITDLRKSGELADTFVVVTADHGEGFGERHPVHGAPSIGHGDAVDETLLHVPLVVQSPEQSDGVVVEDPVGLVDFPRAVERVIDGQTDGPTFETDRTLFAGGFENNASIDVAYEKHESQGVRKYVRGNQGTWTLHAPTPRASYQVSERIPDGIADAMDSLSQESVTSEADSAVPEPTKQQLSALGYTE